MRHVMNERWAVPVLLAGTTIFITIGNPYAGLGAAMLSGLYLILWYKYV